MASPQKARFHRLRPDGQREEPPVEVLFNPTEYTLEKGTQTAEVEIPGLDTPLLQFVRGQNETLTVTLFFDTTERGMGSNARPVTEETDKFYALVKVDGSLHAPPVCYFSWGGGQFPGSHLAGPFATQRRENGFRCIVQNIRQQFTLFSSEGVPLRASLTVTLREYKTLRDQLAELNLLSSDHTRTHVVQQGETLARIAARHYGDSGLWRHIAGDNGLDDPLALEPGRLLHVPPIE
jgi:Contractile injection system tube protein/LysM domain